MRTYADDWVNIGGTIEYSESLHHWYDTRTDTVYDETSARHNGIIGDGALLKKLLETQRG